MKKIMTLIMAAMMLSAPLGCKGKAWPGRPGRPGRTATEAEVVALFDRWNRALESGSAAGVAALYDEDSILLPTLSDKPRLTPREKEEYFGYFLEKRPSAAVDMRRIYTAGGMAVDSGIYTFHFKQTGGAVKARYSIVYRWNGSDWLIVSHHSSLMPGQNGSGETAPR